MIQAFNIPLPHITGNTDREQIMQIKNYLHNLAEILDWALNTIIQTDSQTIELPLLKENEPSDIVVKRGVSDGWIYKKWRGGTYEMHGVFGAAPTFYTTGGTLYESEPINIKTPFPITEDIIVTGVASENCWIASGVYVDKDTISVKIMSDRQISSAASIEIRLYSVGTYP